MYPLGPVSNDTIQLSSQKVEDDEDGEWWTRWKIWVAQIYCHGDP